MRALPIEVYTLRNALELKFSSAHFIAAAKEPNWQGRTVHKIIGCFELLPVVGHIISLIELGIVRFFIPPVTSSPQAPLAVAATTPTPAPAPAPARAPTPTPTRAPTPTPAPVASPRITTLRLGPSLPQPKSCYPQVKYTKIQETPEDSVRYWPVDVSTLGLTELGQRVIDCNLNLASRIGSWKRDGRKIEYSTTDNKIQTVAKLPLSFFIQNTPTGTEFYLVTKVCFKKGGSRTLKLVYNLTTGQFFLKKRLSDKDEEHVIRHLQKKRMERGISEPLIYRTVILADGSKKLQVIEPIRDGTVETLFGTEPFRHFSTRLSIVLDLLRELQHLHDDISWTDVGFTLNKGTEDTGDAVTHVTIPVVRGFHVDIKPDNTLVFCQNETWRAVLCDFEKACNPTGALYSFGYTPPDYIALYKKFLPDGISSPFRTVADKIELIEYNLQFAQKRDVWSMGLVLLAIVTGKTERLRWTDSKGVSRSCDQLAPLPSLIAALSYKESYTWKEEGILSLTQKQIDDDLDSLKADLIAEFPEEAASIRILFLAIGSMLKINPRHRNTIGSTLAFIERNLPKTTTALPRSA